MTNAALKIARRLKRRKGYAGGGAPEAFPEDIRRVHIRSDAPVGEDQSALAGNVDYDTMTGLPITQPEQPPSDAASSSSFMDGTLGRALRRLTGTQFGEPRHQLWPEKMVRSGVSLAGDVLSGDQAVLPPGLRREDYTDIPAPTEPTADSTWLGRQMGWAPQAAQPNDPMMERAQDMAGLAGGQTLLTGAREAMPAAQRALVAAADSQATGAPLAALEHAAQAPRFYSGLERAVEAIPQPTMTGQQWLGTLTNRGVKPDEIQWTGLGDYLAAKADQPVTKAEVAQHLGANQVKLGEVDLAPAPTWEQLSLEQKDYFSELYQRHNDDHTPRNPNWDGVRDLYDSYRTESPEMIPGSASRIQSTRYEGYQLPGGENYREKLITLPQKVSAEDIIKRDGWLDASNKDQVTPSYTSSHWDEPNVLAHRRTNERDVVGANGQNDVRRSSHIEEIQSDFMQDYRKQKMAIGKAIDQDFDGIAAKMLEAGVIKRVCD